MTLSNTTLVLLFIGLFCWGCAEQPTPKTTVANTEYLLTSEPADALEILDAKEKAKDGEPIVVVGRLGGGIKPWIEGRAAFLLVDTRVEGCGEGDKCDENCPGCSKEMQEASTLVKIFDNDGKVLPVDTRQLLGVKELQTIVVRGKAQRDAAGNVTIAAQGVYIRR
jgi:hypothetical protein